MPEQRKLPNGVPINPITSTEEAQACFAGVADGDYPLQEILSRPDLQHAVLYLYAEEVARRANQRPPRRVSFRSANGEVVEVRRRPSQDAPADSVLPIDTLNVIVRNGRVEGFS